MAMTSKTSFFNSLREDMRHRVWVPALACVVFLLSLIFFAVFLSSDYYNQHIWKFSQTQIIKEIQAQPDYRSYVNQFLNL